MTTPIRPIVSRVATAAIAGLVAVAAGCGRMAAPESTPRPAELNFGQPHATGPGPKQPAGGSDAGDAGEAHPGATEMAGLPQLAAFHATLAPRWHAERGTQRIADTCAAIAQFHRDADALAAAAPPSGSDPTMWPANTKQLGDAVTALDAACKTGDAAAFEQAFAQVHERFHGVMEAAGGHHDEHDATPDHEH